MKMSNRHGTSISIEPPAHSEAHPTNVATLLQQRARHTPKQIAYLFLEQGEREQARISYAALDQRARAIAAGLQQLGLAGEPVLLCHAPGIEYIAAFFGCLYAGAIAVPAYPVASARQQRTLPRLQAMIADLGNPVALTTTALQAEEQAGNASDAVRWLPTDTMTEDDGWEPTDPASTALALLMYTSGSTGAPKGVMVSHGNLLHNLRAFAGYHERPCGTVVSWLPMFHDLGLLLGVLHPLYHGQTGVLMTPEAFVQRPARWLQAITRYRATASAAPNFAFDLCVRKITPDERATLDLASWTLALNGAEPIRHETLERFATTFAPYGFQRTSLYPSYGMAEATATISGAHVPAPVAARALDRQAIQQGQVHPVANGAPAQLVIGCGQSLAEQQIVVVDPVTRRSCSPEQIGEIWLAGPSVAQGYWNRPEATAETFNAFVADTGAGPFLRTGDLGFVENGEIFLTGRLKDLIIIHGKNHHPEDIEQTVEVCHSALRPGCGAAFALAEGDEERLALLWEVHTSQPFDADAVLTAIRQVVVAEHNVQVSAIGLLPPGALPKTSSGKIQRGACRAAWDAETLDLLVAWHAPRHAEAASAPAAPPATAHDAASIKQWLSAHLARRLGVAAQTIDPTQPFAHYGLASIESTQLASDLGVWLGRALAPTITLEYPTIALLAQHLAGSAPSTDNAHAEEPLAAPLEPIAIVGLGCRFPGAPNADAFWRLLCDGVDAITEVPADRWNVNAWYDPDPAARGKMVTRWGGFLDGLDLFDAAFFGISPREAAHLDPRQRLMLEVAWEALEDAGIPADTLGGSRTGVFIATLSDDYGSRLFRDLDRVEAYSGTGNAHSVVANRLSYTLGLQGPSIALDTACSGALVAVHLACQSLRSGETQLALVGGVNIILEPNSNIFFSRAGVLAADGRCKTFDQHANGIVRSEGAGLVVLKPLAQAQADGDSIYAVIRGSAVNQDGRTNGLMAPSRQAQEAMLRAAYRSAGIHPREVQYIEAHGTGTVLGDPIEVHALGAVLGADRPADQLCLLGSVKTNIGHTESAAGIAGIIKVALALKHHVIPKQLHFTAPNPLIPFDSLPIRVADTLCAWPTPDAMRVAGVSGFGFGGTNAHVVLAEAPAAVAPLANADNGAGSYVLPLSARSDAALAARALATADAVRRAPVLRDVCYTASARRSHLPHRLAVVGSCAEDIAAQLETFGAGEPTTSVIAGVKQAGAARKLVWVFSGQGSHWHGMGRALLHAPPARDTLIACDTLLRAHVDWSLIDVLTSDDAATLLTRTDVAQPAIFAMQAALAALWQSWGIVPDAIIGQSLGEVAAAHVAGALCLGDAVRVVVERSRLMLTVAGQGATAAVGLPQAQAEQFLAPYADTLSVAGSSSPTASVIAGDPAMLERVLATLAEQNIFCRLLKGIDVAFHSPHMTPLQPQLQAALAELAPQPTTIPLYSTVTGGLIDGATLDGAYWSRNLREPFRFAAVMQQALAAGYDTFVELSPHTVLTGPIQEGIEHAQATALVLPSLRRGDTTPATMLTSLAHLYVAGYNIAWNDLFGAPGQPVALPPYPWQREHYWLDQLAGGVGSNTRKIAGGHPLLGDYVRAAAAPSQHLWELELHAQSLHYLDEHRVNGAVVLPGSAYVEMALAAAQAIDSRPVAVLDLAFEQALVLAEQTSRRVQLVVTPQTKAQALFELFSRSASGDAAQGWVRHATAVLRFHAHTAPPALDLNATLMRCDTELAATEHYQDMARSGLQYGPSFQSVQSVRRGAGEALAQLQLAAPLLPELAAYHIHPALLDAGFQVAAATVPRTDEADDATFLPAGIDEVRVFAQPAGLLWCHATLRAGTTPDDATRVADLTLFASDGQPVAEVLGLRVQRVDQRQRATERVQDWLYEVAWHPQERAATTTDERTRAGAWLIFAARGALAGDLAALLDASSRPSILITPAAAYTSSMNGRRYTIDPTDPAHYQRLLRDVQAQHGNAVRGMVHLWSLDAPDVLHTSDLDAAQTLGSLSVIHLVQALAHTELTPRLWLVTRGAQLVTPEQPLLAAAQAALWGFGRVLGHQERVMLWGGLVDLDPASEHDANALYAEILAPDGEDQIAFRNGQRYCARFTHASKLVPPAPTQFRADGSYLITGGLGTLGLLTARWMVERGARRLVLIGRTPLPPRREWGPSLVGNLAERVATIRALEALGASVQVVALDIADEAALKGFFADYAAEHWPPIRGVIHAAGIVRDQLIQQADPETFWHIARPKIHGAWLLDRLLADAPLDFFVIFASAASLIGMPGQSCYAAANAFLDALAEQRVRAGRPATSIAWGPWAAGMEQVLDLSHMHAARGMYALPVAQGFQAADVIMGQSLAHVAVCSANWPLMCASYSMGKAPPFVAHLARATHDDAPTQHSTEHTIATILEAAPDEQMSLLEAEVCTIIGRVLRMDSTKINPQQLLSALGIDSMMATDLKNSLEVRLSVSFSVVELLQDASATWIARHSLARLQAKQREEHLQALAADGGEVSAQDLAEATAELDDEALARLLGEIETLSDDELATMMSAVA